MRVLHAFKLYRPAEGGVISVMRDLVESAPAGTRSRVLATRRDGPARITVGRASVRRCLAPLELMSLPLAPSYPFRLVSMAREADLVAVHSPFPLAEFPCTLAASHIPPFVVHWHSEVIAQKRAARALGPLTQSFLARAAAVIVSTPGHIEVSPWLGEVRDKCHVVPFGIKANGHQPARPTRLPWEWPETFGVFVGRLVPYKGLNVLLDAAAASEVPLVIAGNGPLHAELCETVRRRGLEAQVCLLGEVSEAEKTWLLQNARFLALPSVGANETFGIVQLEAMIAGLPIINTDAHPGIGWVARHRNEALTVRARDAGAFAAAMKMMAEDSRLAHELGAAGRERAHAKFGYDRFVRCVFDIYRSAAHT